MSSTPGELLKKALLIVEQDLKHITTFVMMGKLDPDSSEDVARYIRALAISDKIKEKDEESQKKTAQRLTDEELLSIVQKMKSNEKDE
ncbi:MAG TPA: hypothetical protein PL071_07385 [Nitrosomonas sp.]|jgi:hypothetical protein|nr:hypothetical protein [Nitrosomonas sp.]